jgi:hypothetical protein
VDRGPNRYYFAVHPEHVRGFVDVVTHPLITALCAEVLGCDYQVVEFGFDVPLPAPSSSPGTGTSPAATLSGAAS